MATLIQRRSWMFVVGKQTFIMAQFDELLIAKRAKAFVSRVEPETRFMQKAATTELCHTDGLPLSFLNCKWCLSTINWNYCKCTANLVIQIDHENIYNSRHQSDHGPSQSINFRKEARTWVLCSRTYHLPNTTCALWVSAFPSIKCSAWDVINVCGILCWKMHFPPNSHLVLSQSVVT